jgi:hypothetical protein
VSKTALLTAEIWGRKGRNRKYYSGSSGLDINRDYFKRKILIEETESK